MNDISLTINQGFQLAALIPSVFVIFYLLASFRDFSRIILPVLYFFSLSTNFLVPLTELLPANDHVYFLKSFLTFASSCLPEISFLLVMQFLLGHMPSPVFFLILAVPIIGGGSFTYIALHYQEVCFQGSCFASSYLISIYRIIASSFVFLLLTLIISRKSAKIGDGDITKQAKYWLIISMVIFNLLILATYLGDIFSFLRKDQLEFIRTMIGISFIYMVLSSIFRVFTESVQVSPLNLWKPSQRHHELADLVEQMLKKDNAYRQIGFSRKKLANQLKVNEHTLSKVINWRFKKTFRELVNEMRIDEAKKQLLETAKPVTMISYDVGFTSITSFNRVFKEATGIAATTFRQSGQGKPKKSKKKKKSKK